RYVIWGCGRHIGGTGSGRDARTLDRDAQAAVGHVDDRWNAAAGPPDRDLDEFRPGSVIQRLKVTCSAGDQQRVDAGLDPAIHQRRDRGNVDAPIIPHWADHGTDNASKHGFALSCTSSRSTIRAAAQSIVLASDDAATGAVRKKSKSQPRFACNTCSTYS